MGFVCYASWSPGLATRVTKMSPPRGWRFPHTRRSRVSRPGLYEVGPPGLRQTMNHPQSFSLPLARTRRHFFRDCGVGVGKMALASLLVGSQGRGEEAAGPLSPKPPHYAPRAKRVIFLFMAGAPSQLDLFDFKPVLRKYDGRPVPAEV